MIRQSSYLKIGTAVLVTLLVTGWIAAGSNNNVEIDLAPPVGHCMERDTSSTVLINTLKSISQARKAVIENITNAKAMNYKRNLVHFIDGSTVLVKRDFSQGELTMTERSLDIAIDGKGFFSVSDSNGNIYYTRRGDLLMNSDGQLSLTKGYTIEPSISIPTDALGVTVSQDGSVLCQDSDGSLCTVGSIQAYRFPNEDGLTYQGAGLFSETDSSGRPVIVTPGSEGAGAVRAGYLESSNVNEMEEMRILEDLKTFEERIQRALQLVK